MPRRSWRWKARRKMKRKEERKDVHVNFLTLMIYQTFHKPATLMNLCFFGAILTKQFLEEKVKNW
jgi:hypothetical protein